MKFAPRTLLLAAAALGIAGCTTPPVQNAGYPAYPTATYPNSPQYPNASYQYGYVEAVEIVAGELRATGPGIGAIGGAIAGGILGNQVGHGSGRAAATVG